VAVSVIVPLPKTPEVFEPQAQGLPGIVLVLTAVIVGDEVLVVFEPAEPEQPTKLKIIATIMTAIAMVVMDFFITHLLHTYLRYRNPIFQKGH
jgi:hypothetical protein